jgi:hypothetical protein
MKELDNHIFDLAKYEVELEEFRLLLESKDELSEKGDILPFFNIRRQLSSQIATIFPKIISTERIAFEFDIFGDFASDLTVGDNKTNTYCFIEFEDAREQSIFLKVGKKYKHEFSPRLEHGFSQLIDWFFKIDDMQKSNALEERFGKNTINYEGLLIIGRNKYLDISKRKRLEWRTENLVLNSKKIYIFTFDELYQTLKDKIDILRQLVN